MENIAAQQLTTGKKALIFACLWLITTGLYITAARAGWVIDAVGFLYNLRNETFLDFINRTHSGDQSFYQVLTLQYYIGYKIWGLNFYMWSLLYITLQAANAWLVFIIGRNLLADSGAGNSLLIPLLGALFFTICPHISEVVICKAYYHYLQCFMFTLLIILWVQKYQRDQDRKYVIRTLAVFFISMFTLEIFYIIPFFILSIALYYHFALGYSKDVFRKTIRGFVLPLLALMVLYFIAVLAIFKSLHVHKIGVVEGPADYLSKIPKYIFHIVFLGRFIDAADKNNVYEVLGGPVFLSVFYTIIAFLFVFFTIRIRKLSGNGKSALLLSYWVAMTLAFVVPLSFPDRALLIFYDRYTYFSLAFVFMLVSMLVFRLKNKYVSYALLAIYAFLNVYFTLMVNKYWQQSDTINTKLLSTLPDVGNKAILLLNVPENMNGAPMIGAQRESEYKMMQEVYLGSTPKNTICDVASYNISSDTDGVYTLVVNDSVVDVAFSQWGNWWWYEGHGARSYETDLYKVRMVNPNRWYELTLKKPASDVALLYNVGDKWKVVDMAKRNEKQN